ncbi:MAG: FAD-binding oxidoreductase [Rhodospirillaceae bacterium]
MNADPAAKNDRLIETLTEILGADQVITGEAERAYYATDVYSVGATPAVAIKPTSKQKVSEAVAAATKQGYAIVPRGGGMSYTGGYRPVREDTVTLDLSALNKIIEVNEEDLYITVEAGVTWQQIYEELKPRGLRLPFFGTFSGSKATVGGGLSNGALFMGTGRYGTAAEIVQCMEVVLADGTLLKTGQPGFKNVEKPFYRTYGPDLTGLFVHDAGSLGFKVQATFRMMRPPAVTDFASFCFPDMESTAKALSEVGRTGAAEEAYVFDPGSTKKNMASSDTINDIKTLGAVVKGQSGWLKGLVEGAKLVVAGRDFMKDGAYSMHMVVSGNCRAAVEADLATIRAAVAKFGAEEIPNSIPKAVRAKPFTPMNGILGPDGDRWAALNAKVGHSGALPLMKETEDLLASYKDKMDQHGVFMTRLMIAIGQNFFSYEPVFHWFDEWYPVHRLTPEPSHLKTLKEPAPNPEASALVAEVREKIVAIFAKHGAASNQIGKTYPYFDSLLTETAKVMGGIKNLLDAEGTVNPGALGFPEQ